MKRRDEILLLAQKCDQSRQIRMNKNKKIKSARFLRKQLTKYFMQDQKPTNNNNQ